MHSPIDPVKRLRRGELSGLVLTEFAQPPDFRVPSHSHECATILFVLKGVAADLMAGRVHGCRPAGVLVRPAGEPHAHHYGREGAHCLVVEVKPHRHEAVRSFSQVLDRVGSSEDGLLSELAGRLYAESLVMDSASELAVEGIVLEVLARVARRDTEARTGDAQPPWLGRAVEFIRANFACPVGLSQIAAEAGVHAAHLAEVFRKHHGCSVGQYVRRLRLDYAVGEVMFSEKSLADISLEAGFYDQSHFTRFFKRYAGMPPAEMRNRARAAAARTKSR
jgi:AraC family transcriptional regulator